MSSAPLRYSVLVLALLGAVSASEADPVSVPLTAEERAWIAANPVIRVGAETDWPPYDFAVAGQATGYSNEMMELLAARVGLEIDFTVGPSFGELLGMLKARELDVLPALWWSEDREAFLTFLPPYYQTSHALFLSSEVSGISTVADLNGRRVAGVSGYNSTEQIREHLPKADLIEVGSPLEALILVNNGEVDGFIGSLGVGGYYVTENNLGNIRVVAGVKHSAFASNEDLHIGVRNDWPLLVGILNKAQASLTQEDRANLRDHWIISESQTGVAWPVVALWIVGVTVIAGLALAGATWRNRRLAHIMAERQAAADAIEGQRAQLLGVMAATDDGIWSVDRQYRATTANAAFRKVFADGIGREIEIGEIIIDVVDQPLSNIWKERYDRALAGERFVVVDENPDGRDLEHRFSPIVVGNKVVGVTCVMHDISAQKQIERNLRDARDAAETANRTKSLFLANMSHEIRTPMNGIVGLTELLADTKLSDGQRHYLDRVQGCADSLLHLINGILNLCKVEAGQIELERKPTDLRRLVNECVDLITETRNANNLSISAQISDDIPTAVIADPARLRQCLINLLSNAVKFTTHGSVTVSVDRDMDEQIVIAVRDTGVGIAADRLAAIFDPFVQADISTTRQFGGTGLGLAITQQLVQLMEGQIDVVSSPGQGSTFAIVLPLAATDDAAVSTATKRRSNNASWPDAKVLVVDDNDVNLLVAKGLLIASKIEVTTASGGIEALDRLRQQRFDLVLMDWHMPDLDGLETTRRIRSSADEAIDRSVPVIALTADAMEGAAEACFDAGMDGYITKPIKRDELTKLLGRFLGEAV